MSRTPLQPALFLSAALLMSSHAFAKKTVGELLTQAQQESRGGKVTSLQKAFTSLPETQLEFEKRTQNNLESVKPPRSSELMREDNSDKGQYEKVLDQQIQELYKLTQKFKNSQNRGELWLRLAELYVEKATLVDSRAQDEYDARIKAFNEHKIATKPKLNAGAAKEYNRKAIKLYEWFEKDFPKDPKMSQALFFLGYNYFELGDTKKGAHYYDRLNKQYPNSPFVGESHFALGEYHFENEKWAGAYKEYSFLIKAKNHRLHSFALYKGAWCLYRLGEYKQGLKYMEYIIRSAREQAAQKADNRSRLETEGLRDIVVFYAAEGDPSHSKKYFQDLLQADDVSSYLEKLAYYYSDKGEREGARILFKQLIADKPSAAKAYEYQYQIVQNYFYSKNSPQFKEELYRWIKDYGANSSWYAANQNNKDLVENAYKLRETTLRNWVLQQHQTAQNSRAPFSQKQASEGYNLYLQEFSQSTMTADMHFYYGELLYDMGKYDEASSQYRWVVDNGAKGKFYDRAGMNLIHAAEKSVPPDQELQKRIGNSVDPIPLDPRVDRFIKAATWHLEKFPNSNKNSEVKFRIGRLYYLHNQFDEASKYFKEVLQSPDQKYHDYSINLLLDIYNLKKDYIGLEKTGAELLAIPSVAQSKAGAEIRGVLEKSNFKKAQDLEVEKKYAESATQFEAFARQNPKSNLAGVAWFNAGVNFDRTGQNVAAIQSYDQVLKSNSEETKPLKPKVRKLLAKLYQDSAQFEEAARLFKESALDSPQDPLASNYIYNAAVMSEALGRLDEAAKLYHQYISAAKRQSEKQDATWALAQIYRKSNNSSATVQTFKDYLELNPSDPVKAVEANYWIYFNAKKAHRSEAETWKTKTLAVQKRLSRSNKAIGNQYASRIRLDDARELLAKYKGIRIPANPQKQKKAVDEKIGTLNELTRLLNEIAKYESAEEVVTSLSILGEANYHMSQAILSAPLPSGLNAQEKKAYEDGMGKIADPFLQKANEAYKAAVDRGFELEVYNDAFQIARDYMSQVDPKNYYDKGEVGYDTRYLNWIQ